VLTQCYCATVGDAQMCCYQEVYSTQDTFDCACILDPDGVLNYIAIAYT